MKPLLNALAFSPDGTWLAVAGQGAPAVVDVATGRVAFEFARSDDGTALRAYFTGAAFSPDGRLALSSSNQNGGAGGLDVLELDDARGVRTCRGLSGRVEKVCLSPSGRWVAGVSQQWRVGVWERATGRLCHVWEVPAGVWIDNTALAFAADETSFYFAGGTHVTRYAVESGERLDGWKVPDGLNDNLFTRPDWGMCSLRREQDGVKREYILRRLLPGEGKVQYRVPAPPRPVPIHSSRVDATGLLLVVHAGERDGKPWLLFYDAATGKPLADPPPAPPPTADELFVATAGRPAGVSLVRAGETDPLLTLDAGEWPTTSHPNLVSGDGKFVCWGRADGWVRVADVDRCLKALGKSRRK